MRLPKARCSTTHFIRLAVAAVVVLPRLHVITDSLHTTAPALKHVSCPQQIKATVNRAPSKIWIRLLVVMLVVASHAQQHLTAAQVSVPKMALKTI